MEFREAVQNWIDSEGHEEIIARPVSPLTGCYDAWNFCKPMELRTRRQSIGTYYHPCKYIINGAWVYPSKSLLPKVRRNGFCLRGCHVPPSELIKLLLSDKEAEILAKNRQFGLLDYKYRRGYREFCMPYSHAIRIARRHKYIIKDADLWMDYLELLSYFNRDVRNPHYVCPSNLKAGHDRLHRKKARIDAAKEEELKRLEAVRWEESYKKAKGKYFGIKFGDGKITVSVIPSVAEIAEEGKAMHHCVYTAKYFNRTDSLILSARDTSGNRLETIEISLKTYKIVQSRAKFNGKSDYHDQIINLVNQNISLIKNIS